MKPKRWTDEFVHRGNGVPLPRQEHQLEEARRKGITCLDALDDPADYGAVAVYTCARFAAHAALRARPDLCRD